MFWVNLIPVEADPPLGVLGEKAQQMIMKFLLFLSIYSKSQAEKFGNSQQLSDVSISPSVGFKLPRSPRGLASKNITHTVKH